MQQQTQYSGYTAEPSDYECQDGQMAESLNLISEDGQMKPLFQPKEFAKIPAGYKVVLTHKTADGLNYILVQEPAGNLGANVLWMRDGVWKTNHITLIDKALTYTSAAIVGNTIVLLAGVPHYILWKDGGYQFLGTHIPNLQMSFGVCGWPLYTDGEVTTEHTYIVARPTSGTTWETNQDLTIDTQDQTAVTQAVNGTMNKYIAAYGRDSGCFTHPFFVRFAFTLYDGTIANRSVPVFINFTSEPVVEVTNFKIDGDDLEVDVWKTIELHGINYRVYFMSAKLDYKILGVTKEELAKWKDIITSVDIYVSSPIYTYEQSGTLTTVYTVNAGSVLGDKLNNFFTGRLMRDSNDEAITYRSQDGSEEFASYNQTIAEAYTPYATVTHSVIRKQKGITSVKAGYFGLKWKSDQELKGDITGLNPCYRIHSIELEELIKEDYDVDWSGVKWYEGLDATTINNVLYNPRGAFSRRILFMPKDGTLKALEQQPTIDTDDSYDYYERDQLYASGVESYNNAVNIFGLRRKFYEGYNSIGLSMYQNAICGYLNGGSAAIYTDFLTQRKLAMSENVYVRIDYEGKKYIVKSNSSVHLCYGQDASKDSSMRRSGNWLYYPNPYAKYMWIGSDALGYTGISLERHSGLNGAFAYLGMLAQHPRNFTWSELKALIAECDTNGIITLDGRIYVSPVNNPFVFSASKSVSFTGGTEVLGLASAAKAMSQGQFGQFPMYAFTTEGVWALEVSASGGYSTRTPVTRDVCTNPEGITQLDSSVVFPTDRGLMLLSGSNAVCISEPIASEAPFDVRSLPSMDKLHAMLGDGHSADNCIPVRPFLDFIKGCRIVYDYMHQRVIVFNPATYEDEDGTTKPMYTYAYVFSTKSQQWGMMYSDLAYSVNSYPEALAINQDGNLVTFASTDEEVSRGLFVTRPLKLGVADVLKTIDCVIQRGHFKRGDVCTALYGSRDLYSWHLIWTSKDHYLRGFRGTPYKYFRIAGVTSLTDGKSVFGASVSVEPRLTDKPR